MSIRRSTETVERITYSLTESQVKTAIRAAVTEEYGLVLPSGNKVTLTSDGSAIVMSEFVEPKSPPSEKPE